MSLAYVLKVTIVAKLKDDSPPRHVDHLCGNSINDLSSFSQGLSVN
jgi:hypothetical protein